MLKENIVMIALMASLALFNQTAHADFFSKLEPVYNPQPILIPVGKSPQQVSGAIRRTLLAKDWVILNFKEGDLETSYNRSSSWRATVYIRYDSKNIRITYKESDGLSYNNETNMIHKTYAKIVRDLEKVIQSQISN